MLDVEPETSEPVSPPRVSLHTVIDARWIFPQISGIGLYTRELLRHLPGLDGSVRYTVLFDRPEVMEREREGTGAGAASNVGARLVPWGLFSPVSQARLPGLLRRLETRVYHSPNYMMPYLAFAPGGRGPVRAVVTIHDLIPLLFPQYTPRAMKTRFLPVFRLVIREAARRATRILVPSRSTAEDVVRELRIPADRRGDVVVTPEAANPVFRPDPDVRPAGPVVLFVGRRDPYKNLPALVRAFARVLREVPAARLVVVGPPDARYPEAEAAAREVRLGDAVEWRGYVDGPGLVRAYREAAVFALPSRYEGFGLPVIEAMACGTPVVCGNGSSLPEVAGDAAALVPPDDEGEIAAAVVRVLTDPAHAAALRERGLHRAAQFSWERTARLTLDAYRAAAG
ncbi:MAG: glycosyltransferase family 4 protein [Lentisphaerae bacterium]|nr:glycosyltransferase family 4 protein [Lentisphaerota bacterium]